MRFLLLIPCLFFFTLSYGKTIRVGPGEATRSLKKAIDMSRDGDSILLLGGIYKEGSLVISKSIVITGLHNPVVDGEYKYEIFFIKGRNITIRGLELRNSGYSAIDDFASVKLADCHNVIIESNIFRNSYFAIHVSNSQGTIIRNNRIYGAPVSEHLSGNGIHLWKSTRAQIENNQIKGHRDGIYFEFVSESVIRQNLSEDNIRYGLHFMFSNNDSYRQNIFRRNGAGVAVMYSKKVEMTGNYFELNWGASAYGLLLKEITDSYIYQNRFSKNTTAIYLEGTSRIKVNHNTFKENGWAIKVQASCDDNTFHKNNFTGNSFDVSTNGTLMLNRFSNNYWDRYEGYDLNKDGVGDIPYHPVSLYSMIIEQNPATIILYRSFMVSLLDKAEKAIPGLTPVNLVDEKPMMKMIKQ